MSIEGQGGLAVLQGALAGVNRFRARRLVNRYFPEGFTPQLGTVDSSVQTLASPPQPTVASSWRQDARGNVVTGSTGTSGLPFNITQDVWDAMTPAQQAQLAAEAGSLKNVQGNYDTAIGTMQNDPNAAYRNALREQNMANANAIMGKDWSDIGTIEGRDIFLEELRRRMAQKSVLSEEEEEFMVTRAGEEARRGQEDKLRATEDEMARMGLTGGRAAQMKMEKRGEIGRETLAAEQGARKDILEMRDKWQTNTLAGLQNLYSIDSNVALGKAQLGLAGATAGTQALQVASAYDMAAGELEFRRSAGVAALQAERPEFTPNILGMTQAQQAMDYLNQIGLPLQKLSMLLGIDKDFMSSVMGAMTQYSNAMMAEDSKPKEDSGFFGKGFVGDIYGAGSMIAPLAFGFDPTAFAMDMAITSGLKWSGL